MTRALLLALAAVGVFLVPPPDATRAAVHQVAPRDFELQQNFPNPFNAQTNISFTLKNSGHARLEVFDILGREVDILVDSDLEQGSHTYTWDAGSRESGIFFYRLSFEGQTMTGRMILLK